MAFVDPAGAQIPSSTYRLQLNSAFTLKDATRIVPYLADLGVGACYLSPILMARPGSLHGYDATDHGRLNPEIGTEEDFQYFAEQLRKHDLGLIVDLVPNHVCISDSTNWRWFDVLENGPSSPHAKFFDIDWNPPREDLANKVLLPILGDQYGKVLENQEIQIEYSGGTFYVRYYDVQLPLAPKSWPLILQSVLDQLRGEVGDASESVLELESIITALNYLPPRSETDEERIRERIREREIIKRRLSALASEEAVARALTSTLRELNGVRGDARSFDKLEQLLADQAYRLSFWRVAADEINYRRFFDINELAAIRIEDPEVFQAVNEKIFEYIRSGWITGLRIDHPDGLFDPYQFFKDLQRAIGEMRIDAATQPGASADKGFYVVAEKIIVGDEELRSDWAIHGTVGYGYLNSLNGLFVRPEAKNAFLHLYQRFTGIEVSSFDDLVYDSKRLILRVSLSSELNVLSRLLDRICQQHRHTRDFTLESLRFALREIIACMPVYRTYVRDHESIDPQDREIITSAVTAAKRRNPATSRSVFDAIASILKAEYPDGITETQRAERMLFVRRLQQLTGPVMAKGVEDTAFYRWYPLGSLNEVGGEPSRFGVSVRAFHEKNQVRAREWPHAMLATSTHDTKRSEDVRARLDVLSEMPGQWFKAITEWHRLNSSTAMQGNPEAVDANAEYLLYQTLVGAWPLETMDETAYSGFVSRIQHYMEKALHEAKVHTSWINPNVSYDAAVREFVALVLDRGQNPEFLSSLSEFVASLSRPALLNGLSQVLLKIASPGVPDFYQGTEMWKFNLVDPDNRRQVDYENLRAALARLEEAEGRDRLTLVDELYRHPESGLLKQYVTSRGLRFRRKHEQLFAAGSYIPLHVAGSKQKHVVAFAREESGNVVIAAAGRLYATLMSQTGDAVGSAAWAGTAVVLPRPIGGSGFCDALTGRRIPASRSRGGRTTLAMDELFAHLPVALLYREEI